MQDLAVLFDRLKALEDKIDEVRDAIKIVPVLVAKRQENRKAIESLAREIDAIKQTG